MSTQHIQELLMLASWHGAQVCSLPDYAKVPREMHQKTADVLRSVARRDAAELQQNGIKEADGSTFLPHGIAHLLPPFTLSAHQLRHALQLANPDGALDPDQLDTKICLQHKLPGKDTDGEDAPAGLYCWLAEYPEEGSICIDQPWAFGPADFNLHSHLHRQRAFSEQTFGPGMRTQGVVDHIRKELMEVLANPTDLSEWIDVAILALDGAWRTGDTPEQIIEALVAKQDKNERRIWPDWRTAPADKAIEHVRANKTGIPATHTVHCPNGPVHACDEHVQVIQSLANFLGGCSHTTAAPAGALCSNCQNEAQLER